MHTAFQDGYMSNAMWLIAINVAKITQNNAKCESLLSHIKHLVFPAHLTSVGRQLHRVFSKRMVAKHFKKQAIVANASQQFTLYALIRDWAIHESMGVADAQPHLDVYLAACEVIDLIRAVKHRQLSTADAKPQVLAAIGHWNVLHRALYKKRYVKPKHFWMWLVAVRLADAEWLFDMFYVERQHRRVRPQAELVTNTISWEPSVLFRVLHAQLCTLSGPSPIKDSYTLLGRQRRVTGCVDGWMADKLVCGGLNLHTDDTVFGH